MKDEELVPAPPRLVPGVPSALSPLIRASRGPEPEPHDGPGHEHLSRRHRRSRGDRSGPGRRRPHRRDRRRVDARPRALGAPDAHASRSLARGAPDPRGDRRARSRGSGSRPKADEFDLKLDLVLADGTTIDGTEFRLEALHTPGHAPNHLCFFLEEERVLFTGDHVLNGTTTVVNPKRGGDMIAVPRFARTTPQDQAARTHRARRTVT